MMLSEKCWQSYIKNKSPKSSGLIDDKTSLMNSIAMQKRESEL